MCCTSSTATPLIESKDENTKTPVAFCSLATKLDPGFVDETPTPLPQCITMNPSTPATNQQGGGQVNEETIGTTPNTVLFPESSSTTPNQPFAKSFSLNPTQVKEACERVKSHLTDGSIWELIESQPAPLRDIMIWFCNQMDLTHLGHKQCERALRKFIDIKDGDFYISRSINIQVSLNKTSNLAESKEAEVEILGFANTLYAFQRGASEHMHMMAKLEHTAARNKIAETCAGLADDSETVHQAVQYTKKVGGVQQRH
jgi:hypothetical protein